jgi:MFS family permease
MKASRYRKYLLAVLAIILAFNCVDRLALGIVLQDIKLDLHVTDTQLGLLTGIAFAFFYSIMGIPIARWADRGNRVTIIAITTTLWGAALALSGFTVNFVQLLLVRMGVAVGEAGGVPSSLSLISDHFSRAERPRAVSLYLQGVSISIVLGYFAAGWLDQFYGWRVTFIILGLPGILLAALAWASLRDPRFARRGTPASLAAVPAPEQLHFKVVCKTLWANITFRHLLFFYAVLYFFNFGIVQWQPAFFVRSYGIKTGELGTWISAINGIGMMIGLYLGGEWASRRAANNERLQLKAMAIAYGTVGFASCLIYFSSNRYLSFAFMAVWSVAGTTTSGPLNAMIQSLVPERMRATAMTMVLLFANLIGAGLGPLLVGTLSDLLRPLAGEESLRYALLALSPGYLWGAWHLLRASRTVTSDVTRANAGHALEPSLEP